MDCIIVWRNGRGSPFWWYMALPDVRHHRRYQDVSIHISSMDGAWSTQPEIPRLIVPIVQGTHTKLSWLVNIDLKKMMVHIYKGLLNGFQH